MQMQMQKQNLINARRGSPWDRVLLLVAERLKYYDPKAMIFTIASPGKGASKEMPYRVDIMWSRRP